jgi:hypothetical protein
VRLEYLTVAEADEWVAAQEGRLLGGGNVGRVVGPGDEDVAFLTPGGRLVAAYLECPRPEGPTSGFHGGLRRARDAALKVARWSERRRATGNIAGWFDKPHPRVTAFTRDRPGLWRGLRPLLLGMDGAFRERLPDLYAAQRAAAAATHSYYVIPGTPFTTVTCNRDWRSPCHLDDGNLGLSVMWVFTGGDYAGGLLVLPKWRLGFDLREGRVLVADLAREYHGNTPVVVEPGDGAEFHRLSVLLYARAGLLHASDPAEEYRRYRLRHGGR